MKQPELLKQYVERSVDRLVRAIQDLSQTHSLEDLTRVVRVAARDVVQADGATVVLIEGDQCYYADEDAIAPLWKGRRFPAETCVSGWAMRNKQQVVIPDIFVDARVPQEAYKPTFVKSLVMTPVRRENPLAAIGTYWADNHEASEAECAVLQSLADMTAIGLENIRYIKELERANITLEERVKQRTEDLRKAHEELQQLAHVVSHELQGPLRTITSHLGMLSARYSGRFDEDADEFISSVTVSARTVERMLDSLWIYARVNSQSAAIEEVDANELFDAAVFALRDLVGQSNPCITKLTPLPTVRINRSQLLYVMQQLFENAIVHGGNKNGSDEPLVELSAEERDGEWVFIVKDYGRGFDMMDAQRIFDMFHRINKTSPGTGMGLAICRKVLQSHDGRIWAQSTPGAGSSFYFSLPVARP